MPSDVTNKTSTLIHNTFLRDYLQFYQSIDTHFFQQIQSTGMDLDENYERKTVAKILRLKSLGAQCRNNDKSIYRQWLSPACAACRKGTDSSTFYLSLMCHRNCYYCFNPNQEDYDHFSANRRDCIRELEAMHKTGQKPAHIALTGGEPLLHAQETVDFFRYARDTFRRVYTRLYTAGDLLDRNLLQQLKDAQLNEIRFSIKLEDSREARRQIYERITWAKDYIPHVMVEMPVIPGTLPEMKQLLSDLDNLGLTGINLLEFCFPYHNAQEFRQRSFKIKNPPYQVLYNYWYAGGLPVSRSDTDCLNLLEFALEEKIKMGVHYCSLENKHTGQIFQLNSRRHPFNLTFFSPHDFYLKTAKVFGADIPIALRTLKKHKITSYQQNKKHNFLEFHVQQLNHLKKLDLEVGISSNVIENREGVLCLRELRLQPMRTGDFDIRHL